MSTSFVHLHSHSHFSFFNGTARPEELVRRAKELGMPALALTDYCNLYGAQEFDRSSRQYGIKPIFGIEFGVAGKSRYEEGTAYALTLLAMNQEGWQNLMRLSSLAFLEGFHNTPTIDKELLQKYNRGLICLSGFAWGEIGRLLVGEQDNCYDKAKAVAGWYRETFGDRYYLELRNHGVESQKTLFDQTVAIGKELDIPTVATHDIHYIDREDWKAHDILLCLKNNKRLADENRPKMDSDQHDFRSANEMYAAFTGQEDAVKRTVEIAERIEPDIFSNLYASKRHPVFPLPPSQSADELLHKLCLEGLEKRYKNSSFADNAKKRLESELSVIKRIGQANYFLFVGDITRFAQEQGIYHTARGSAVGSMVCYVLGISHECPLEFGLLFERFLDENRVEAPDIDIDFANNRLDEVVGYIKQKYGELNVAKIGVFGTIHTKAAINDVGRVLGKPVEKVNDIASLIPGVPFMTFPKAFKQSEALRNIYETDREVKELIDYARKIEGLVRSAGTHACAFAIADKTIMEYVPLQTVQKQSADYVTQWAMGDAEAAGLLKMDFLGLRSLSILSRTIEIIRETTSETIDPYKFPLDDRKTFDLLCHAETTGVFQFEAEGIQAFLQRLKPDRFCDIIAALALYRPGPIEAGLLDQYIAVKHGMKKAEYAHPAMEKILSETYGIMLYQERIMELMNQLGNIPLDEAFVCIKEICKRKDFSEFRSRFIEGFQKNTQTPGTGEEVFDLIVKFAPYGFCKSHAAAYVRIAYMAAYLKAHYPEEFAVANSEFPPFSV